MAKSIEGRRSLLLSGAIAHAWVVGLCSCLASSHALAQTTLKLAHVTPRTHPFGVAADRFAANLERLSGGALRAQVVPNGAMGGLSELWVQLRTGSLEFHVIDVPGMTLMKEASPVSVVTTPFLFRDQPHLRSFLASELFREMLTPIESATGVRFVGQIGDRAPRAIGTTRKPVRTVADLRGVKMRVPPGPLMARIFEAWGAVPTPLGAGEIGSALRSGMVDGDDNGVIGLVTTPMHKLIKHFTPVDMVRSGIGLFVSGKRWATLDVQARQWIELAARQSGDQGAVEFDALLKKSLESLPSLGVQLHQPDDSFRFVTGIFVAEMEGRVWPAGLVAKIREMR